MPAPASLLARVALPVDPGAFRLVLALLVFVHHFSSLDWGSFAVYVFFVLSGFWVQRMWTERYRRARSPYLTFMVSRVWRLAPTMLLVSAITLALLPAIGIPDDQLHANHPAHLALSSSVLLGYAWLDYLPVGSAWSLDVEMQYYILAPALAVLAARAAPAVTIAIAALVSIAFFLMTPELYLAPKYALFFVAGLVAAHVRWTPSPRLAGLSAGLVVAIVLAILISPWRDILVGGSTPGPLHVHAPALNVALAVLAIPFAIHTTTRASDATDRMFADLSYIIYLLHWVAMQWFFQFTEPFSLRLAVAAASFTLVPAASWLIWRFYDRPLNRARARWVSGRMTAPPGLAETVALRDPPGP